MLLVARLLMASIQRKKKGHICKAVVMGNSLLDSVVLRWQVNLDHSFTIAHIITYIFVKVLLKDMLHQHRMLISVLCQNVLNKYAPQPI